MDDQEKPLLWYPSSIENERFRTAIAYSNRDYESMFSQKIDGSNFSDIHLVNGVVFVGPQTSKAYPDKAVFQSSDFYFRFVDEVHRTGLRIVAVLNNPLKLPRDNRGIDKVIELVGRERSVKSISDEITNFFDSSFRIIR